MSLCFGLFNNSIWSCAHKRVVAIKEATVETAATPQATWSLCALQAVLQQAGKQELPHQHVCVMLQLKMFPVCFSQTKTKNPGPLSGSVNISSKSASGSGENQNTNQDLT